jgi:hypothetical protein
MGKVSKKNIENNEKQWLFFYTLLQAKGKFSEISGDPLYGELNSTWFHHIYPKSKYPNLRYCPENIIIVTPDEHNAIELGQSFPELEKRKKNIAEKYDILIEDTKEYLNEYLNPIYEHVKSKTNFFKKSN